VGSRRSPNGGGGLAARLAHTQLVVVTGKGGVGKSTVSATLSRCLEGLGRRTLLLEVDPRESLHRMLDVPPSGGEIVRVSETLWLQNLPPRRVMDEVVRERLRVETLVRRVLASPVYHHFVDGAPGLKELAVLGHAFRLVNRLGGRRTPRIETVVLDAPATGHGVSLLAAPAAVLGAIHSGPFARMARDLAELVGDPARSAIVAVTTAEEMPVQETVELLAMLRERLGRVPEAVIVNALLPAFPTDVSEGRDEAVELWRRRRGINQHELVRLGSKWEGTLVELPLLPLEPGPELVAALRREIEAAS
jgi:anion-transporting  ArsA/GET3 family ATPase